MNQEVFGSSLTTPNVASPRETLATVILNGSNFYGTMYQGGASQYDEVMNHLRTCHDMEFLQKLAVYCVYNGSRDGAALVLAYLTKEHGTYVNYSLFDSVITNGMMLKKFVKIRRSGLLGSRSLGSRTKKMCAMWLESRDLRDLVLDNVGNVPMKLVDVMNLVHPCPKTPEQMDLFAWIMGRPTVGRHEPVRSMLAWNEGGSLVDMDPRLDWRLFSSRKSTMTSEELVSLVGRMGNRAIVKNLSNIGGLSDASDEEIITRINGMNLDSLNASDLIGIVMYARTQKAAAVARALFNNAAARYADSMDCTVVVDNSGSMGWAGNAQGALVPWDYGKAAAALITPAGESYVEFATTSRVKSAAYEPYDTLKHECGRGGGTNLNAGLRDAATLGRKNILVISDGAANIDDYTSYYSQGQDTTKAVAKRMIEQGFKIAVWNLNTQSKDMMDGVLSLVGNKFSEIERAKRWFAGEEDVDLVSDIMSYRTSLHG